jgi:hypothetical protein
MSKDGFVRFAGTEFALDDNTPEILLETEALDFFALVEGLAVGEQRHGNAPAVQGVERLKRSRKWLKTPASFFGVIVGELDSDLRVIPTFLVECHRDYLAARGLNTVPPGAVPLRVGPVPSSCLRDRIVQLAGRDVLQARGVVFADDPPAFPRGQTVSQDGVIEIEKENRRKTHNYSGLTLLRRIA